MTTDRRSADWRSDAAARSTSPPARRVTKPDDTGRIERFMLWADDEFGSDLTWLLIMLAVAALRGIVALVS